MLIDSHEAARRLGVKPATLYAYVSRGLLRSVPGIDSRARRYDVEDVERLKRLRHSRPRTRVPPKPFDDLVPVLDTSLSLIENGHIYYRGIDATKLAETEDLEAVAGLLWQQTVRMTFVPGPIEPELNKLLTGGRLPALAMDRARVIVAELAMHDVAAFDAAPSAMVRAGSRIVPTLAAAVTGAVLTATPMHQELAQAWGLAPSGSDLVRRCLVLTADHELNASTYVGRCIASTGASPYSVILGALGALSGPRHGGETSKVEALLRQVLRRGDLRGEVAERLQRGERIPGFGHPLYPDGDPRARHLLEAIKTSRYRRQSEKVLDIGQRISDLIDHHPNIDFALGLVSILLRLPPGSGVGLFLVGRSVGWIAHAIEQYALGTLIRPRARYVGELPL
jgi:citrate synthase